MAESQDLKQDQSMEEILQSIKRIIAEDESVTEDKTTSKVEVKMDAVASEVLKLTDLLEAGDAPEPSAKPSGFTDVLNSIDETLQNEKPRETKPNPENDILQNIDNLISNEVVTAASNSLNNLKQMQNPQPQPAAPKMPSPSLSFRSGTTVEDLVVEALRPELRDWLNNNLTNIVERMVAAEIKKISSNN
jgi:cell pole-organizing protein PopZ